MFTGKLSVGIELVFWAKRIELKMLQHIDSNSNLKSHCVDFIVFEQLPVNSWRSADRRDPL